MPVTSKVSLIARITIRAKICVCCSDLRVNKSQGRTLTQRIKGTQGITGLSLLADRTYKVVWHLDVDLFYPGAAAGSKGFPVRELRGHMNWV